MNKNILIKYFHNRLKLSIKIKLNKDDHNRNNKNKTMKKVIDVKAKNNLLLSSRILKIDNPYFRGYRPAKNKELIKVVQNSKIKNKSFIPF